MSEVRPAWLARFALVSGRIPAAPLDLPQRMESVYAALQRAGWRVVVRSIGTDFTGPLGLPVPRAQPIELYLAPANGARFAAAQAQAALASALRAANLNYSPLGAWLEELRHEVLEPTVHQAQGGLPWLGIAGLALAAIVLLGPRRF